MYDFAIVALLALATLKLVDFLTDAVPQLRNVRSLVTFVIAVGATVLLDYSVFQGFGIEIRNATVGTWVTGLHRRRHDRSVAGALRVPHPRPGPGRRDPRRADPQRPRRVNRTEPDGQLGSGAAQRRVRSGQTAYSRSWSSSNSSTRHQHGPRLRTFRRPDDAPPLEQVHEPAGAGEADPQLALQHRRRAEPARDDELHRLVEQLVALVVVGA